jgi:hypothetical protein
MAAGRLFAAGQGWPAASVRTPSLQVRWHQLNPLSMLANCGTGT